MGRVKGLGFLDDLEYVEQRGSPAQLDRVKASLSDGDRGELFGRSVLPVSWVDFGASVRFLVSADQVIGHGDLALLEAAGEHTARKHLNGVYKLLLRVLDPSTIVSRAGSYWRRYHDTGDFRVEMESDRSALGFLEGYPDVPLHHERTAFGWTRAYVLHSGARDVKFEHVECAARGDRRCVTRYRWTM